MFVELEDTQTSKPLQRTGLGSPYKTISERVAVRRWYFENSGAIEIIRPGKRVFEEDRLRPETSSSAAGPSKGLRGDCLHSYLAERKGVHCEYLNLMAVVGWGVLYKQPGADTAMGLISVDGRTVLRVYRAKGLLIHN